MKLVYQLSDAGRKASLIATGRDPGQMQVVQVDLAELSTGDRRFLVDLAGIKDSYTLALPEWQRYFATTSPYELDEIVDDPRVLLAGYRTARALKQELFNANRDAWIAEQIKKYRDWSSDRDPNYETFDAYKASLLHGELLSAWRAAKEIATARRQQLAAERERQERQQQAEKERRLEERRAWALEHGSPRLRKSVEGDYDCQRLYVTERAAIEHPGYAVDFNDKATWRDRSGPSEAALDEARRVGGIVVWLTSFPISISNPEEYEVDWEDEDEAVVIRNYLGKYDLIKRI